MVKINFSPQTPPHALLSDADFPYWHWKRITEEDGPFNPNDGKCEPATLLPLLDKKAFSAMDKDANTVIGSSAEKSNIKAVTKINVQR